jgi:hypothetical protein
MSTLNTTIDFSKIFLGGNKTITATYTNGSGSAVTLTPGQVFGRVTADAKVALQDKDSTDGSQLARFVLMSSHASIANGASATVTLCYAGEVDASKLVWGSGESLTTAVGTVGINQDILTANSQLILITGIENTALDNA